MTSRKCLKCGVGQQRTSLWCDRCVRKVRPVMIQEALADARAKQWWERDVYGNLHPLAVIAHLAAVLEVLEDEGE